MLKIDKDEMVQLLKRVKPYIEKREELVNAHCLISTIGNKLEIKAFDTNSNGIILKVKDDSVLIDSENLATANGIDLLKHISNLEKGYIELYPNGNELIIKQKKRVIKLEMYCPTGWKFPNIADTKPIDIDIPEFIIGNSQGKNFTASRNIDEKLNSMWLDISNGECSIVATDTKRLYKRSSKCTTKEEIKLFYHVSMANELPKLIGAENGKLSYNSKRLIFETENEIIVASLYDGVMMDYRELEVKGEAIVLSVPKNVLEKEVKFMDKVSSNISVHIANKGIMMEAIDCKIQASSLIENIDLAVETDINMHTCSKNIKDILPFIDSDNIKMYFPKELSLNDEGRFIGNYQILHENITYLLVAYR